MADYLDRPVFDSETDCYYAVTKGHPFVVGDHIQRSDVRMDGEDEYDVLLDMPDEFVELSTDYDDACRILALRISLDDWKGDYQIAGYFDRVVISGNREWLVVTDEEADELWDQDLDNYLEECVLSEMPERMRYYFDTEKWKKDARIDGRAHSLARYDGNEDDVHIEGGETYYIYRTN